MTVAPVDGTAITERPHGCRQVGATQCVGAGFEVLEYILHSPRGRGRGKFGRGADGFGINGMDPCHCGSELHGEVREERRRASPRHDVVEITQGWRARGEVHDGPDSARCSSPIPEPRSPTFEARSNPVGDCSATHSAKPSIISTTADPDAPFSKPSPKALLGTRESPPR